MELCSTTGQRHRRAAQFGALALSEDPSEGQMQGFQRRKGQMREEIQALDLEIENLKMIACRAETSMASLLREPMARE
jgi:hypothetical protein